MVDVLAVSYISIGFKFLDLRRFASISWRCLLIDWIHASGFELSGMRSTKFVLNPISKEGEVSLAIRMRLLVRNPSVNSLSI